MISDHLWDLDGFSVVVSLDSPKGTDLTTFLKYAERIKGRADAILINDCPDGLMRMTPMAASKALLDFGMTPIMGQNARDRNRIAIQGDLLGAWSLGLRHVLFKDGKDPAYGDHPLTKSVFDIKTPEMVEIMEAFKEGRDMAGGTLTGKPEFGFAVQVDWLDSDDQIEKTFAKMGALTALGARAFVTSPQFDLERTKELLVRAKEFKASIYIGVMMLKSVGMARYLNEVPGISKVPEHVIGKMNQAPVKARAGIEYAVEFIKGLEGLAQGVVILPIGWELKVPELLEGIGR